MRLLTRCAITIVPLVVAPSSLVLADSITLTCAVDTCFIGDCVQKRNIRLSFDPDTNMSDFSLCGIPGVETRIFTTKNSYEIQCDSTGAYLEIDLDRHTGEAHLSLSEGSARKKGKILQLTRMQCSESTQQF